jgi:hypothetical protein
MKNIKMTGMVLFLLLLISETRAQYNYGDRLRLDISPFVWMTTMNGNLTLHGETRKINFTFKDFFTNSNLGLSGHIELKKGSWGILGDWIYVDLLKDQNYSKLTLAEISLTHRVSKLIEIIAGGRYFKIKSEFRDDPDKVNSGERTWTDPIAGARLTWDLTKHIVFSFRADVGGFGIGSNFSWNVMGGIGYRLYNITFLAAYRIWYADYENGSGDNLFAYDITTSGPGLAMIIHF